MSRSRVYLDWNATTPLRPEAKAAMAAAFELAGNPSSVHAEGRQAKASVERARRTIAAAVGAEPGHVIFTSGGSEANALALTPELRSRKQPLHRLIVSAIEHASVLAGGRFEREQIELVGVTPDGLVDTARLAAQLANGPPALVSVMLANNETGAIQPIAEIAEQVHRADGILHVDAIQAFGKIDININTLGSDMLSLSAHKLGGPKGIGALVLASDLIAPAPLIHGGGQELSRRAGTENIIGVAGFAAAVEAALETLPEDAARIEKLRDRLENGLRQTGDGIVFASAATRLPNTTLFSAPGLKAETAVIGFDLEGIAVSSGSACSSGKVQPSHVLEAMGVSRELARGGVRVSLGGLTTEIEIDRFLEAWRKLASTLLKGHETQLERF